ncbi:MAG: glucan 1,4-alpha-glucosidase [Nitrospiria bacterium]
MFCYAPGWPGQSPRWTSSAKSGVGASLNLHSRIRFTVSHGIINEIYHPRIDTACTRDMGLIVTDGTKFFSEEKRHTRCHFACPDKGVPAFRLVNQCLQERFQIEKEIITDPNRDVVLQQIRFVPLTGTLADYRLYVLLAPHLGNHGNGNTAWIGPYKGVRMLLAEGHGHALALGCSAPWLKASAGFVGISDGWQDLVNHYRMTWLYDRAENGNVALTAEIDLLSCKGSFLLALGFGNHTPEAGHLALASLVDGFEKSKREYIRIWKIKQKSLLPLGKDKKYDFQLYPISIAVLLTHQAKHFRGGIIASLSIPWGFSKSDNDLGGYHLIWPRDMVESAGGLLAVGAKKDARETLDYLRVTQEMDGHWPQNMWMDGTPYWDGLQMDETALPILLLDLVRREEALTSEELLQFWPMVRKAAGFIVQNGPMTQQDRWEEEPGFSPFTLAAEIAALLVAAELADLNKEPDVGAYLRETADLWNDCIERCVYVKDTDLSRQLGVQGYYVRIAPPDTPEAPALAKKFIKIKNNPPGQSAIPANHLISPDALALVRFGLRSPDDPRILDTVKVIDALVKFETPGGPSWYRYNGDGYGEHEDGSPFDGSGIGRPWPLLTGERAHYEIAAGNQERAESLLATLESFANEGGLIPEQIWDSQNIPERELFLGKPTGAAMPLVWAHSEYLKLCRSLKEGFVFDMPAQTVQRYIVEKHVSPYYFWRFNYRTEKIPPGKMLRVELLEPAVISWSKDDWKSMTDTKTEDKGLGVHVAAIPTRDLIEGTVLRFTFFWTGENRREEKHFSIQIAE